MNTVTTRPYEEPIHPTVSLETCDAHTHANARPPRWKQALATLLALYPTVVIASTHLGPRLGDDGWGWPGWVVTLAITTTAVITLAWVLMPIATQLLASWLKPAATRSKKTRSLQTSVIVMALAAEITTVALTT